METLTEFPPDARCIFCKENVADEVKFGKIYRYDDVITHYFCMVSGDYDFNLMCNAFASIIVLHFPPNT